eukprot:TRINITY_DN637_c0_g1_i1.p1 TRINITY_DN637_c0_g1~~TRINITY_DN637_c0_g1_i1.p1  ORF type:complete len:216 (-),score=49.41 TRINITY_DN637_c0_g1_i1:30-629(-)
MDSEKEELLTIDTNKRYWKLNHGCGLGHEIVEIRGDRLLVSRVQKGGIMSTSRSDGEGTITDIRAMWWTAEPNSNYLVATVLLVVLGIFGAHRFYSGQKIQALTRLGITVTILGYFILAGLLPQYRTYALVVSAMQGAFLLVMLINDFLTLRQYLGKRKLFFGIGDKDVFHISADSTDELLEIKDAIWTCKEELVAKKK